MNNYITGFTSYFIFSLFFHYFFIHKGFAYKCLKDKKWFFKTLVILPILIILIILSSLAAVIMTSLRIYEIPVLPILFLLLFLPLLSIPLSILTPDYKFADIFKPKGKIKKYEYIKLMNGINLTTSIMILFSTFFSFFIFMPKFTTGFIVYRCISRSIELIMAFGRDAVTPKKESILTAGDRVKLAINSYIEVIFNYAVLYHLLSIVGEYIYNKVIDEFSPPLTGNKLCEILDINYNSEIGCIIKKGIIYITTNFETPKIETIDLFTSFFKSIGISTFSGIGTSQLGIFSSLHLFTSFVLVVFAIAVYLSNIGEEHKEREVSKALLKSKKNKIDKYLKSNEYKLLDKKNLILGDLKAYKENLLINFDNYIKK